MHTYKPYKDKYGVVIDWETTGSTWGGDSSINYQGISVGIVVFDTHTLLPIDTHYIEIKFDETKYQWSSEAERIHGISREHLEKYGVTQEEAAVAMLNFLIKYFDLKEPILFMGHNVDFDICFTRQLLVPFDVMFELRITKLDTSCLGYLTLGYHKSNDIFEFLGLNERSEHNALEDALLELEAVRRIRMLVNSALGI